jgi:hypothetical protein
LTRDVSLTRVEAKSGAKETTKMTEANEHIQNLIAARDTELEHRRGAAKELAKTYTRGHTENMREAFDKIQDSIEAIERAIAHEEFIASKETRSSWPNRIGFDNR